MDFSTVDTLAAAEKGFDYTFIHPVTKEETDCVISVIGAGSRPYKQAMAKIEAYKNNQFKRGKSPDDEVLEELHVEMLAKCTKGWKNVQEGGKDVPFNYENAKRMYSAYPVMANQVLEAIHNIEEMLEKN